jgi:hypothetical protein
VIATRITNRGTHHVWTRGAKDAAGDYTYSHVDAPDPVYVEVQQQQTIEKRDGRSVVISVWVGYFRPDATLDAQDEVTVDGFGRFAFEGDPWPVRHPRLGTTVHWRALLRKVT